MQNCLSVNLYLLRPIIKGFFSKYKIFIVCSFSSLELKTQLGFSYHILSVCKLFALWAYFSKTTWLISIKFSTRHYYGKLNINCKNESPVFFVQKANFVPNCSFYENIEEWAVFNQFITSGSLISKTRFFVWNSHIGRMINGSKSICLLCNSSRGKTLMQDIFVPILWRKLCWNIPMHRHFDLWQWV